MKKTLLFASFIAALPVVASAQAVETDSLSNALPSGNSAVPGHAVVLTGGENGVRQELLDELYSESNHTFNDPSAPRFLLIDKKGNTVFGIGGQIEGVVRYDFGGAQESDAFNVMNIAVPANPARRERFSADATRSSLVFHLLRNTRLGVLSGYVHADFSGQNYGFKLRQAYIRLHNVTAGLAISTFQDVMATPSSIDYNGPVGQVDHKTMQLQYRVNYANGLGWGIAAELPPFGATYGPQTEAISQRVPDLPAYIQYQWAGGKSHIRASAMLRNLSYRDLATASNRFATGYGVQLSGVVKIVPQLTALAQATYGRGIASYMESTMSSTYDLIPSATTDGHLNPTPSFGFVGGLKYKPLSNFFVSTNYSMLRLYGTETVGPDAFHRGNYAAVNAFYNPLDELQVGIEYIHGRYKIADGQSATANRIELMVKYSF